MYKEPWDNEINECDEMTSNLESLLNDIDGINEEDECDDPDWKDEELVKVDLHVRKLLYSYNYVLCICIVTFDTIFDGTFSTTLFSFTLSSSFSFRKRNSKLCWCHFLIIIIYK